MTEPAASGPSLSGASPQPRHEGAGPGAGPVGYGAGPAGPGGAAEPDEATLALAHTLFQAARDGDTALLGRYLDAGAPATMTNAAGDSLLMLAAYHGHAETVQLLLQHGGEANTANDRGQTPLAGAAFKGYAEVAQVLLHAGADPDAGSPSARAAAQMFARTEILDLFGR